MTVQISHQTASNDFKFLSNVNDILAWKSTGAVQW